MTAVKICRFLAGDAAVRIGLVDDDAHVVDLTPAGITTLSQVLESADPVGLLNGIDRRTLPRFAVSDVILRPPIERQEVWAAGVTYLRSKTARMEESDFSATAYDRVYDADRPEIFFKALAEKVVPTGEAVGIRRDATWSVPEPELALVINSRGQIVGCTIGNDMSSRDIEGENLLYLPQAKVYDRSCALGPWIRLGVNGSRCAGLDGAQHDHPRRRAGVFRRDPPRQHQAKLRGARRIFVPVADISPWRGVADRHRHRAARRLHASRARCRRDRDRAYRRTSEFRCHCLIYG